MLRKASTKTPTKTFLFSENFQVVVFPITIKHYLLQVFEERNKLYPLQALRLLFPKQCLLQYPHPCKLESFRPNLKVHFYPILPHSDLTTGGTLFSLRLQSVGVWFEPK